MSNPPILYTVEGHIARITLDRPQQHNAIGSAEIGRLHELLDAIDNDHEIRVLLLSGRGAKTFCAGAALDEMQSGAMDADLFNTLTDALARLRVPSLCALNGSVFGGGAEIALCCDYRIGVSGMRLLVPASRLGLCYPVGGMQRYVDKLGLGIAKRILVASEELNADTLLAIGFVHRVVAPADLERESLAFATHLAGLAPLAVQAMKKILGQIAAGELDVEAARTLSTQCALSADLQEGLAAKRERRAPRFTGN